VATLSEIVPVCTFDIYASQQARRWNGGVGGDGGYLHQVVALYSVDGDQSRREEEFFSCASPYLSDDREAELVEKHFRALEENETREFITRNVYWDALPRSKHAIPADEEPQQNHRY
jgi:hypothetical protein